MQWESSLRRTSSLMGEASRQDGFSPASHAEGIITSNGAVFYPHELLYPLSSVVNVFTLSVETLEQGPPRLADPPGMFTPLTDDPVFFRQHLDDLLREEVETLFHENPLRVVRAFLYPTAVAYHAQHVLEGPSRSVYREWWLRSQQILSERLAERFKTPFSRLVGRSYEMLPPGAYLPAAREDPLAAALSLPAILITEVKYYPYHSLRGDGQRLHEALRYERLSEQLQSLHMLARESEQTLTHHLSKA